MEFDPEEMVREVESAYAAPDIDRVMGFFEPEIVLFWNGVRRATGLDEVRSWHQRSFATVRDYRIRKTLRVAAGDTIAVEWTDSWLDTPSNTRRLGYGAEFWTMRGDRLREWHAYWRGGPAPSDDSAARLPGPS